MDSPWFVPLLGRAKPIASVLAFPHAGAGCAAFASCAAQLGPQVSLHGLNLPGRQARFGEPPVTDPERLTEALVDELVVHVGEPYVLFGYCSGALLAHAVAVAAVAAGLPAPQSLVVAAHPAPHLPRPPTAPHTLATEDFWAEVLELGGFPAALVAQPAYREIFEPALRADYELVARIPRGLGPRLPTPITVLAGNRDPYLDDAALAAWAEHTDAECGVERVEADHWLLEDAAADIARVLERECRR